MPDDNQYPKAITRRDFITGAAAGALFVKTGWAEGRSGRQPVEIDYITNTDGRRTNIGSLNQALGVVEALQGKSTGAQVNAVEYDMHDLPKLAGILSKNISGKRHIVLAVGDDGVQALGTLPPPSATQMSVLIGHEVPKGVEAIKDKISILAIPEHVTDYKGLAGVQTIRTHGVSHAMTQQKAAEAADEWREKLHLAKDKPVIVVMLGGTVDGKDYTPEEARTLGEYVAAKAKERGAAVLTTNSPRAKPEAIRAFNEGLGDTGIGSASFPFIPNQKDTPFAALVGLVKNNDKSMIVATGDSVSMPSEARSVVKPSQLTIYSMSNQNSQNTEFVKWMHENGQAIVVTGNDKGEKREQPVKTLANVPAMDAACQIADAIRVQLVRESSRGRQP